MKIKSKIVKYNSFLNERTPDDIAGKDPKINNVSVDQDNRDLRKEIDDILNNLKKLEINLDDQPTSKLPDIMANEELEIIYEQLGLNEDGYDDGYQAGKAFAGNVSKGAIAVGAAVGVGILLIVANQKAKKRIKKRIAEYAKYYPAKGTLELKVEYADRLYDVKNKKDEITDKKVQAFKDKVQVKIDAEENVEKKKKMREIRDERIKDVVELVNKQFESKKQKNKEKLEKELESLNEMWKVTEAETDFRGFFEKLQKSEGPYKMSRLWEEGRIEIEKSEDPKLHKKEQSYINRIYKGEEDRINREIEKLDVSYKEKVKEKVEAGKKKIEEIKKDEVKAVAAGKAEEKERVESNPEYANAVAAEGNFKKGVNVFRTAVQRHLKLKNDESAAELKKAFNSLKSLDNATSHGTISLKKMKPAASENEIEAAKGQRKGMMDKFKEIYDEAMQAKQTQEGVEHEYLTTSDVLPAINKEGRLFFVREEDGEYYATTKPGRRVNSLKDSQICKLAARDAEDMFNESLELIRERIKPTDRVITSCELESGKIKENRIVLTEKLNTYDDFLNESKMSDSIKKLGRKMKKFFKAVGNEGKETKDAVKLVYQAKKNDRPLTDEEKEQVKEQLKDVLKTIGLSYLAIMPGGFIVAVLLKTLELEDAVVPSSFKS